MIAVGESLDYGAKGAGSSNMALLPQIAFCMGGILQRSSPEICSSRDFWGFETTESGCLARGMFVNWWYGVNDSIENGL